MADLYDITNWNPQPWFSTKGTRDKKFIQSPKGKYYYFKESQFRPGRDYKYEFWSEIIAYEIGRCLKFDVLRYDIAIEGNIMGCICESMIDPDKEDLIEGIRYLQAHDSTFAPENTSLRKLYTFQLIENALSSFNLGKFIYQIIEIIVFDSIIGNSDRHQENWAFINNYSVVSEFVKSAPKSAKMLLDSWHLSNEKPKCFAPIYDNGSSLGRELTEERVVQFLQDENLLQRYVEKGTSEIHWDSKKLGHFELIRELLNSSYGQTVKEIGTVVRESVKGMDIDLIISDIDKFVPESHSGYKLPAYRKLLITKIISLRIKRLLKLLNEGV